MFGNAHFRGPNDAAFEISDFLGVSDRAARQQQMQRDAFEVHRMNMQLAKIVRGGPEPEGLPEWARGA